MLLACTLALVAIALQILDYYYHRVDLSSTPKPAENVDAIKHYRRYFRNLSANRHDNILAILVYARVYMWIIAAGIVFHEVDEIIIRFLMILFVTGRFR